MLEDAMVIIIHLVELGVVIWELTHRGYLLTLIIVIWQ